MIPLSISRYKFHTNCLSFASVSKEGNFLFRILRNILWVGDMKIIPNTIYLVLGKNIQRKYFRFNQGSVVFGCNLHDL